MKNGIKIIDMRCRPPYRGFLNEGYPFGLYDVAFAGLFRKMTNTTATPALLYKAWVFSSGKWTVPASTSA